MKSIHIYKASAGSGKTFNLVREFLTLLLGTRNPETGNFSLNKKAGLNRSAILGVTFTNKSTEEMKQRIIKEISLLAFKPDNSEHIEALAEIFNVSQEELSSAAERELPGLLFHFSEFNISTIDSFFQHILRSFAAEINRPANFEVELDTDMALTTAADEMLSELTRRQQLTPEETDAMKSWIIHFIRKQIEDGKSFNIFNREGSVLSDTVAIIKMLMNETFSLNRETIQAYLSDPSRLQTFEKKIGEKTSSITAEMSRLAKLFFTRLELEKGASSGEKAVKCKIGDAKFRELILTGDPGIDLGTSGEKALENPAAFFSKTPEPSAELLRFTSDMLEFRDRNKTIFATLKVLRRHLFYLGILAPVLKILSARCLSENTILIQQTTELLRRIIGDETAPFIYEKTGNRLRHYLIDEFQDTSRMQWENFRPLILDTLGSRNNNLIIGDEKQCIYRFRNSEPELLGHEVRAEIETATRDTDIVLETGNLISENTNHRSSPEVVVFNNSLFSAMGLIPDLSHATAYTHAVQALSKKMEGRVRVHFIKNKDKKKTDELRRIAGEKAVDEIARLLKTHKPGDIAVLVRKNREGADFLQLLLEAMKPGPCGEPPRLPRFNIISGEALPVNSSKSVMMIINILRLIDSPAPDNTSLDTKERTRRNFKSDLASLIHNYHLNLSKGSDPDTALLSAADPAPVIDDEIVMTAMNNRLCNLSGLVERIISRLPEKQLRDEAIFIAAFQDAVEKFTRRGESDIHSFLEWWDKTGCNATIDSPSDKESLVISTIHKSKGVEYDCVVIPYADWNFEKDSSYFQRSLQWHPTATLSTLGFDKEIIPPLFPLEKTSAIADTLFGQSYHKLNEDDRTDNLNVTYVAFTRAKKELCIVTYIPDRARKPLCDYLKTAVKMTSEIAAAAPASTAPFLADLNPHLSDDNELLDFVIPGRIPETETGNPKTDVNAGVESPSLPMPELIRRYPHKLEALRIGKIDDGLDYDPEKTRMKSKFGLSKLGTDEQFTDDNIRIIGDFLHNVLRHVTTPDTLRFALETESENANLSPMLKEKFYDLLSCALELPQVQKWFVGTRRVITERPFASVIRPRGSESRKSTRRPDRVVWTSEGTVDVIDYKFGDDSLHTREHTNQVRRYTDMLRKTGEKNVRGFLWYVNSGKIIEI